MVSSLAVAVGGSAQVRYLDEIFDEVDITLDGTYGVNYSVEFPDPFPDTLQFDLYQPAGDDLSERPVVITLHNGYFMPRGVFMPVGGKDDYANVQLAMGLARRGYCVMSIDYRIGWNPLLPTEHQRRASLVQALYRAIQDVYCAIRFLNKSVKEGNPLRLDMDRVALAGIGTGGVIAINAALLNDVTETYIPKFSDPVTGEPMIDTLDLGNLYGDQPAAHNISNHPGYGNDFHFIYSLDGALADTSWLFSGSRSPIVCGHVVGNPWYPFGINHLGEIECNLPIYLTTVWGKMYPMHWHGSACVIMLANMLGINDVLLEATFDDSVSQTVGSFEYAQEQLWPIHLSGDQAGPWEYWDSVHWSEVPSPFPQYENIHESGLRFNPDMSMEKANHYIDTLLHFFAPRACVAMGLNACDTVATINEVTVPGKLTLVPNPARNKLQVAVDPGRIRAIRLHDLYGRVVLMETDLDHDSYTCHLGKLLPGIYVVSVETDDREFQVGKVCVGEW